MQRSKSRRSSNRKCLPFRDSASFRSAGLQRGGRGPGVVCRAPPPFLPQSPQLAVNACFSPLRARARERETPPRWAAVLCHQGPLDGGCEGLTLALTLPEEAGSAIGCWGGFEGLPARRSRHRAVGRWGGREQGAC